MTSPTHYDVLGVEPDAPRDEIRDAYRARVEALRRESFKGSAEDRAEQSAAVNRAWNVLSDPFQRERYDEELRATADAPAEELSVNGDGGGPPASGPASPSDRRAGETPVIGGGLRPASTRARVNGLLIDVAALILIVFALGQVWTAVAGHEAIQVTIGGSIDRTVDVKGQDAKAFEQQVKAQEVAKQAKKTKSGKQPPKVSTKQVKVLSTASGLLLQLVTLLAALAYTVPASALTGQTLGKRIAKTRLVSVDGSPASATASLVHYGVPILLALALQVIGVALALGMVIWSLRDRNKQGIDDKIARTFVVGV